MFHILCFLAPKSVWLFLSSSRFLLSFPTYPPATTLTHTHTLTRTPQEQRSMKKIGLPRTGGGRHQQSPPVSFLIRFQVQALPQAPRVPPLFLASPIALPLPSPQDHVPSAESPKPRCLASIFSLPTPNAKRTYLAASAATLEQA